MKKKAQDQIEEVKAAMRFKLPSPPGLSPKNYVSTGSTVLNLALTGRTDCGFGKGKYYRFVGDSSSGKSFLALTCLAEASINPAFDGYDFYFDDSENGVGFDFAKFFGEKMAGRVKPPRGTIENPTYSATIEDFYDNVFRIHRQGRPFIYVEDSMDALESLVEEVKAEKQERARERRRGGEGGPAG